MCIFERRHTYTAIVAVIVTVVFFYIFLSNGLPFPSFLYGLSVTFLPSHTINFIKHPIFLTLTPQKIWYGAILFISAFFGVLHLVKLVRGSRHTGIRVFFDDLLKTTLVLVLLSLFLQTTTHLIFSKNLYQQKAHLSADERYTVLFTDTYLFAQFCKQHINPNKTVAYATDLDLDNDPGQFLHRLSAYFLYPVDIRNIRGMREGDTDYIICFIKEYDLQNIPVGYALHARYSKDAYILKRI